MTLNADVDISNTFWGTNDNEVIHEMFETRGIMVIKVLL